MTSEARRLRSGGSGFLAVMLDVLLGRFGGVVRGVMQVALSGVSVVSRSFVVTGFVMPGRFTVMPSGMLVVLCRADMVFCRLFGHVSSLK
jgi:hypothetical protein